jgi:hypothetical protein
MRVHLSGGLLQRGVGRYGFDTCRHHVFDFHGPPRTIKCSSPAKLQHQDLQGLVTRLPRHSVKNARNGTIGIATPASSRPKIQPREMNVHIASLINRALIGSTGRAARKSAVNAPGSLRKGVVP